MTKERFNEMLLSLIAGNTIEIERNGQWHVARMAPTRDSFEVMSPRGFRPAPLGGPGHKDWRYQEKERFLG